MYLLYLSWVSPYRADLDEHLFDAMSPFTRIAFRRLDRARNAAMVSYCQGSFVLSRTLAKAFSNAECSALRIVMAYTSALIGGSTAIEFFMQIEYVSSNVDIYVRGDRSRRLILWLLSIGFRMMGESDGSGLKAVLEQMSGKRYGSILSQYGRGAILRECTFTRSGSRDVRVLGTFEHPLDAILGSHSSASCVPDVVYCLQLI